MVYKAKNLLAIASILVFGLSFGISQNDKTDARDNKSTFVCNKNKEKETREYQKNLKEQKQLSTIQTRLLADSNVANDTCKKLKKKEQARCQQDVAELRRVNRDLVKINQRISEYELCYLAPKCGTAINGVFFEPPSGDLCSSGTIKGNVTFEPLTLGANGEPVWKWECSNPQGNKTVSCSAQSIMAYGWQLGEWSVCLNGEQHRTTNCVLFYNREPIDMSYCGEQPESSRVCDVISNVNVQSSHYSDPLDAANYLADLGIIANHVANPSLYGFNNPITRQNLLAMVLRAMKIKVTPDYQCQNIFSDISDSSVCAIAEIALANGLISKQTNEEGVSFFRGTNYMTIYEIFILTLKSQCIRPDDTSLPGIRSTVARLGITNATTINMSQVASQGDTYLSFATFHDYFNANTESNPSVLDSSIVTCADRIDRSDEDVLCRLFPDLCQ